MGYLQKWMVFSLSLLLLGVPSVWAYDLRDNAILHAQQGILYMELSRDAEAVEEFQIAIRLNPASAMAATLYNDLGLAFQKLGKYPEALASFQRALRLQPGFELYYKNLIQTYVDAGALSEASQAWKEVLARNPQDGEAWFLLGLIYETQGEQSAAKAAFSKFLLLEPNAQLADAVRNHF